LGIAIRYQHIDKRIVFRPVFKRLIAELITDEGKELGKIVIIFTTNTNLLDMNREYLNHHYYTDVITFSESKRDRLSGDIYVSLEQVELNSKEYQTTFEDEVTRVIIHGVLHLIGYEDVTETQKNAMREREDSYLCRFKKHDFLKSERGI